MTAAYRHFVIAAGIFAFALAGFHREALSQGMTFDRAPLTLITQSGRHELTVDVAGNGSQAEFGLRYRGSLGPDEGLLILQSRAAPTTISINTDGVSLPLDLLFIASDGTIMEVHPSIPTDSATPIVSNSPVGAALELAAGAIVRYGILPGDKVIGSGLGSS
jgi:uncharacterized membrane protein (UPF0127 family)